MAQFAVIEQAKKSLKTVQDYIKVGMETTIDVAQDIAESKIGKFNSLIHCFNVAFCFFCVFIFTVPAAGINGLNIYQYRYRYTSVCLVYILHTGKYLPHILFLPPFALDVIRLN